jgi:type II secretory pathway pseudopilin PulG
MRGQPRNPGRAFTLVEALLAVVILGMTVTAITVPFTAGAQEAVEDARQNLCVSLAQDLVEEIMSKNFADTDGAADDTKGRWFWDDMSDYNGYTEAAGNIHTADKTLVNDPLAAKLSRIATVVPYPIPPGTGAPTGQFLKVTVEVRNNGNTVLILTRLAYNNQ